MPIEHSSNKTIIAFVPPVAVVAAVSVGLMLYRRQRKTANLKQFTFSSDVVYPADAQTVRNRNNIRVISNSSPSLTLDALNHLPFSSAGF
jgi:hypothetical protein